MENNPLVSILMTSYNRENYIADAIGSALLSSYQNFELIICDDASTDKTVEIARNYQQKDSRILIYINEKNLGDYYNRNKAASYAKGKYIKYLDSDDLIMPDGLRIMVMAMESFPEAALGITQFETENVDSIFYPVCVSPEQAYLEHYDGQELLRFGPTGTIIRTEIFKLLNCFGTTRFLGDTEFWLKATAKYCLVKIEPGVVFWREHVGQEYVLGHKTHTYLRKSYTIFIDSLLSPLCPLKSADIKRIILRLKWKHARDILQLAIVYGRPSLAVEIFREADFGILSLLKGILPYSVMKYKFIRIGE